MATYILVRRTCVSGCVRVRTRRRRRQCRLGALAKVSQAPALTRGADTMRWPGPSVAGGVAERSRPLPCRAPTQGSSARRPQTDHRPCAWLHCHETERSPAARAPAPAPNACSTGKVKAKGQEYARTGMVWNAPDGRGSGGGGLLPTGLASRVWWAASVRSVPSRSWSRR